MFFFLKKKNLPWPWSVAHSAASMRSAGGAGSGRLYRVRRGDDLDVDSAQYFVNSSLSPVLFFRRRVKSVADVL